MSSKYISMSLYLHFVEDKKTRGMGPGRGRSRPISHSHVDRRDGKKSKKKKKKKKEKRGKKRKQRGKKRNRKGQLLALALHNSDGRGIVKEKFRH